MGRKGNARRGGSRKKPAKRSGKRRGGGPLNSGPDKGSPVYSTLAPARKLQRLKFPTTKVLSTGTNVSSVRFTANGAYDVDPTLGSTSTPGFAEWAAFYGFYRVKGVGIEVGFVTQETLKACQAYIYFSNTDPGTSANFSVTANPLSKVGVMGVSAGKSTCKLRQYKKVSQILGSNTTFTDDNYRALTNAVPADLVWIACGAQTLDGTNFTGSVVMQILITMDVEFYDRKTSLSAFEKDPKPTTDELGKFYSEYEEKRKIFKELQGQKVCPHALKRNVSPDYHEQYELAYAKAHK